MGYGGSEKHSHFCNYNNTAMSSTNKPTKKSKKNKQIIPQEQQMRDDFNLFWNQFMKNNQTVDYYGLLTPDQLIGLKKVLGDVNNIITMRTTIAFAEELRVKKIIDKKQHDEILQLIDSTNPNSPGFDVNYADIIAEVKCNIPADGDKFGQAQKDGIVNDIHNLIHGKGKINDTSTYYKFFVLLDDDNHVRKAMKNLMNSIKWNNVFLQATKITVKEFKHVTIGSYSKSCIYIVYIPINSI